MSKQKSFSLEDLKNIQVGETELKVVEKPKAENSGQNKSKSNPNQAPNVGWLYYFDYFREWSTFPTVLEELKSQKPDRQKLASLSKHLQEKSRALFQLKLADQRPNDWKLKHLSEDDTFKLTTTYPGLLAGIGYQHETKIEGELKLGFYFDYTSGLPAIPGSSIKGILRSAFRGKHWDFLREILLENAILPENELPDDAELERWELEVFEGIKNADAPDDKPLEKYLRSSERDIFHDAIIWRSEHKYAHNSPENQPYSDGTFLGQDFITPHHPGEKFGAFKEPVPLRFMKVLPKVTFLFQFDLKNSPVERPLLTKGLKLKFFKALLLNLGIGAKTNVGYGQFAKV